MKTIKHYIVIGFILIFSGGCDNDFVEINTNPYAVTNVDPALLLAGAQRTHLGTWAAEHTIVQQFVCPYNTGANLGFNFNADIDLICNPKWTDSYPATVRNMVQALQILGANTTRVNLRSMLRIWKAQVFMGLVDEYGDVPYFEAGKAVSSGIFFPVYDDDAAIYDDLYKEITEALASFNTGGDFVSADLFYGTNAQASTKTTTAADQVAKWKKLGNSLLLRLGMRYSKIDATKAAAIVAEAFAGGVMTSNSDNAYVKYDGTLYVHAENNNLRNFSHFNYAAEPFVNQLKATSDPRAKYMIATYTNPGAIANQPNPDTNLANQYGVPIGVTDAQITAPGSPYRGANPNGGLNYSQWNVYAVAAPNAPDFWVTYAQTSLLLAEAAQRGWVSGSAQTYYENGITADMQVYALYPGTTPITDAEITAYITHPDVAFNATDALELINTQYWIVNLRNGTEAFANFRRSGYPALSPNLFNNNLNGGFARRMSFPDVEGSANPNFSSAVDAIGGDNLLSRVFWDN
ncbi:MAG TPA: SusD/RagB family nutrient-binding outer membrane lipoprotein [Cyclobacteriaceae bacterium]|nr:SusD/RagB family nutrient-binding outer membrane lipoprotein [Cyclobacteriaceae bacterium]